MDWQIVKVLREEKSAIKTAARCNMSQPAVMYRLNKMEEEFGVILFSRSNHGISFTSAGERLLLYSDKMLQQYSDIKDYVRSAGSDLVGTISIGATSSFTNLFFPHLLQKFRQQYSKIQLQFFCGKSDELLAKLERREISIGIIRGAHEWNGGKYTIAREPIMIASSTPIDMEALPHIPYINYRADPLLQSQINSWWAGLYGDCQPNTIIYAYDTQSCLSFVECGLGFSIMPAIRLAQSPNIYKKALTKADGSHILRETHLFYHQDITELDAYNAFLTFFLNEIKYMDFSFS